MNPQVATATFPNIHLNVSTEDGEHSSSRVGSQRVCSPRGVSPMVLSPRMGMGSPRMAANGNVFEQTACRRYANAVRGTNAKQRAEVVEWLNGMLPGLRIPADASEEDLRRRLVDGTVLFGIIKKLNPGLLLEGNLNVGPESPRTADSPRHAALSIKQRSEHVKKFLFALDELGLPKFDPSDLEQGPITAVVECLLSLKDHFTSDAKGGAQHRRTFSEGYLVEDSGNRDQAKGQNPQPNAHSDSRFQTLLKTPATPEPSSAWSHHVGQKSNEVFQTNEGRHLEAPAKSSGMMNLHSLDNAPTQSLLSLVNSILGDKQNGEVPPRIEMLLRKVMQEIERRLSTQGEHVKKLKLALKEVLAREERLVSRAGVLETLATGTSEEIKMVTDQLQKIKTEKDNMEERRKLEEKDVLRLMREKEEIELAISSMNQDLETTKKAYETRCLHLETQGKEAAHELEEKIRHLECCLKESKRKSEELDALSKSMVHNWKLKEVGYQRLMNSQLQVLEELRVASQSSKKEILDAQRRWLEEISDLGVNLRGLADAAQNYHLILDENRRLYNEVQDLKGNIRVYCRVRPFLPGQASKESIVDYVGEDGELLVSNPSKPGKDGQRMFKFNKAFGPTATQEDVFRDTQPLIRSVLDGFNVCIFAYGQTGAGKTFTMSGPDQPTEETWGVNYRALNDLFFISRKRKTTYSYEVGVQMVEIYNEQIRDLLSNGGAQKKLGILSTSQSNGLSVPDATMLPVNSTADVLELMDVGQMNRAVSATAMNERSSRSHSVLTVHVRSTNLKTRATLHGSLHLVDLAGSERVDRSEATGDRLKEAQHINKSLSALGDVIYSLAQKSSHIPYRNSKLTQILQGALGGQAKTLMFVQVNPDVVSYSESMSSLKFAERVSGVELGAAKSNKETKETRDLMEQVAQMKELIARKDAEIERLQSLRGHSPRSPEATLEKGSPIPQRIVSPLSPPSKTSSVGSVSNGRRSSTAGMKKLSSSASPVDAATRNATHRKTASDLDYHSEFSDRKSEISSQQSSDDFRLQKPYYQDPKQVGKVSNRNSQAADVELLGFGDGDSEERLSDISDSGLSMGTETDGSISSIVEYTLFPEPAKDSNNLEKRSNPTRFPRSPPKPIQSVSARPQSGSARTVPSRTQSGTTPPVSPRPHSGMGHPPPSRSQSITKDSLRSSTGLRRSTVSQAVAPVAKSSYEQGMGHPAPSRLQSITKDSLRLKKINR